MSVTIDGSSGVTVNGSKLVAQAPIFSAYRGSSNQSVSSGVWTKVQCQVEEFDTASAYDNATNYRFQPSVPGYYQFNGQIVVAGTAVTFVAIDLYKNGSPGKLGAYATIGTTYGATVNGLIYLNGSTDYVELYGYVTGTSPVLNYSSGGDYTYFQGYLVRGT